VAITAAIESVTLEAWLAPPAALSERGELHCFINRRPIRDRHLQAIARSCYQELGGEPAGALYLDIRSDWVDVNVHPQKWEVRIWRHERLFPWVRSTLRKGLASAAPPSPAPEIRGGESLRQ